MSAAEAAKVRAVRNQCDKPPRIVSWLFREKKKKKGKQSFSL